MQLLLTAIYLPDLDKDDGHSKWKYMTSKPNDKLLRATSSELPKLSGYFCPPYHPQIIYSRSGSGCPTGITVVWFHIGILYHVRHTDAIPINQPIKFLYISIYIYIYLYIYLCIYIYTVTVTVRGARRLWRHQIVCIWNAPNRKCRHMTVSTADNRTRFTVSGYAKFHQIFRENGIDFLYF